MVRVPDLEFITGFVSALPVQTITTLNSEELNFFL